MVNHAQPNFGIEAYAVADLRLVRFAGFIAWMLWVLVHIYFLIGFANRFFVLSQWALAFLTKRRQVRVFPSAAQRDEQGGEPEC